MQIESVSFSLTRSEGGGGPLLIEAGHINNDVARPPSGRPVDHGHVEARVCGQRRKRTIRYRGLACVRINIRHERDGRLERPDDEKAGGGWSDHRDSEGRGGSRCGYPARGGPRGDREVPLRTSKERRSTGKSVRVPGIDDAAGR